MDHPRNGLARPRLIKIPLNGTLLFFAGWATGSIQASILMSGVALLDEPIVRHTAARHIDQP